ncbi:hypothetical protein IKF23_02540 [Candidatus Saccharibacteria bacterium]|nr:hypothetical protein [Candidatus Saccharibacteria bacterium]
MEGNQNGTGTGGAVNFGSSLGGGNTMGTPTAGPVGAFGTGMTSAGQGSAMPTATNPFGPTAPIASGTGSVTLQGDKKRLNKKWIIVGLVSVGLVAIVIGVVFMMNNGRGAKAHDLKSAFNIYANYYLSGEAKDEDLSESEINEAEGASDEDGELDDIFDEDFKDDADDAGSDGSDGSTYEESGEDGGTVEDGMVDEEEPEYDSYFGRYLAGEEENEKYLETLNKHFETFYNYYLGELNNSESDLEFIKSYKKDFDLAMTYYSTAPLDWNSLLAKYTNNGESATSAYIEEASESYKDLDDEDFHNAVLNYAEESLKLMVRYDEAGCISEGEVDYECVDNNDAKNEEIDNAISRYDSEVRRILNNAETNIGAGIYELRDIVYSYVDGLTSEEREEMEEDGDE